MNRRMGMGLFLAAAMVIGSAGCASKAERAQRAEAKQHQKGRNEIRPGSDSLGPSIQTETPIPRHTVGNIVRKDGSNRRIVAIWMTGSDVMRNATVFAPHKNAAFGPPGSKWVERRLMCATVKEFRVCCFFGTANGDRMTSNTL